jgi:GNAT superfamily N-acetyltransferase
MRIRPFDRDRDLAPSASASWSSRTYDGCILVAEVEGAVAGFVTVHARFRSDEPDDGPMEFALVSDIVVLAASRRRGIGRRLLEAAKALYATAGFRELEVHLEKALA